MNQTPDTIEVEDTELLRLIERNAAVERICTGFRFSEGPIWNPKEPVSTSATCRTTSAADGARSTASSKCATRATNATA